MISQEEVEVIRIFKNCFQGVGGDIVTCGGCGCIKEFIWPKISPTCGSFCPSMSPGHPRRCHCKQKG